VPVVVVLLRRSRKREDTNIPSVPAAAKGQAALPARPPKVAATAHSSADEIATVVRSSEVGDARTLAAEHGLRRVLLHHRTERGGWVGSQRGPNTTWPQRIVQFMPALIKLTGNPRNDRAAYPIAPALSLDLIPSPFAIPWLQDPYRYAGRSASGMQSELDSTHASNWQRVLSANICRPQCP
jgi:hypothetical protein